MRKKTAFDIIDKILREVEQLNPSAEHMLKEVQMMRFKIRPLVGDISTLHTMHHEVIESLWKIGKIDEIISASYYDLEEDDQNRLLDYLNNLETKAQNHIKDSLEKTASHTKKKQLLKLEVFKDVEQDPVVN